uniref:Nucleolar protein 16 n=1 Tax=Cynoglossus semilaevis TaxID=244447 RepID=A0A3P8X4G4_CYNSE
MVKTKQSKGRKKFDYDKNRKKLKKKFLKKQKPTIEDRQVRRAWDEHKSVSRNLRDMGLSLDPNRSLPIKKSSVNQSETPAGSALITKPYVLNQLEEEAGRPQKNSKTLSSDLIEFVQHMIREHQDDHKAMARDEKNYYQDTPSQIRRKINDYKRCHPVDYQAFISSLSAAAQ